MKKILALLTILILMSFNLIDKEESYTLTIKVEGLRNTKGEVIFALYNKDGSIPDEKYKKYFKKGISSIDINNAATFVFSNLPKGIYAVNILHDENKNGKIDKGLILPKEGVGFSNYESIGLSNRPKFSKASFELNTNTVKELKVIYF